FFFTVFVNADADLGFTNFPVDKFYLFLTGLAYDKIAAEQTGTLAEFTADLKGQLQQSGNLDEGLDWLKDYFQSDFVLQKDPTNLTEIVAEIERALAQSTNSEKAIAATSLILKVRRKDSRKACRRFGCSQQFLQKYFSGR
ncbi:MAG: hypothetical protein ACKO2V_15030, partial [Snowella sp.]